MAQILSEKLYSFESFSEHTVVQSLIEVDGEKDLNASQSLSLKFQSLLNLE